MYRKISWFTHPIYHEGTYDSRHIKQDALHSDIWNQNSQSQEHNEENWRFYTLPIPVNKNSIPVRVQWAAPYKEYLGWIVWMQNGYRVGLQRNLVLVLAINNYVLARPVLQILEGKKGFNYASLFILLLECNLADKSVGVVFYSSSVMIFWMKTSSSALQSNQAPQGGRSPLGKVESRSELLVQITDSWQKRWEGGMPKSALLYISY